MSAATVTSPTTTDCPAKEMEPPCSSSPSHSDTNLDSSFTSTSSNADNSQISIGSQDNERRRRKRTTAQDKSILEAAYQRDTKPDKQARLDIVSRVSMNEKEVQIWFQNRRQNDRRKTRPLSIHEVESLRYRSANGVHIAASTTPGPVQDQHSAYSAPPHPYPTTAAASVAAPQQQQRQQQLPPYDPVHASFQEQAQNTPPEGVLPPPRSSSPRDTLPPPPASSTAEASIVNPMAASLPSSQATDPELSLSSVSSCSHESSDGVGYLSNRRNTESFSSSFRPDLTLPSLNPDTTRRRAPLSQLLNDTPSNPFKITLSLDGKAELAPTISPPRAHRHYSAYDANLPIPRLAPRLDHAYTVHAGSSNTPSTTITSLPPISSLFNINCGGAPPRLSRGSSKNAQTWEQIADTSDPTPTAVTDSLTTQADDEVSGSARAAISLIRKHSSSSGVVDPSCTLPPSAAATTAGGILANNNGKRNATAASNNARGGKKAKLSLGRTMSSFARLETPERSFSLVADSNNHNCNRVETTEAEREDCTTRSDDETLIQNLNKNGKGKGGSDVLLIGSPTDSEKENWSPDSAGNPRPHSRRRRRQPIVQPSRAIEAGRKVLEDSMPVGGGKRLFFLPPPSSTTTGCERKAASGVGKRRVKSPGVSIFEDARSDEDDESNNENEDEELDGGLFAKDVAAHSFDASVADEEVERFMRGDVSPSKKGDADAVHGLLSLKGAWS